MTPSGGALRSTAFAAGSTETLAPVFEGRSQTVLFRGYLAMLTTAA